MKNLITTTTQNTIKNNKLFFFSYKNLQTNKLKNDASSFQTSEQHKLKSPPCKEEEKHREELALCYRLCSQYDFCEGQIHNHLTVAFDSNTKFLIHAYGKHWSMVNKSNLLLVNYDGHVLRGAGVPDLSGFFIHSRIHNALGDRAKAILHLHSRYATVLSCVDNELERLLSAHYDTAYLRKAVAYDIQFNGIVESSDEGARISEIIKKHPEKRIIFHKNHGITIIGKSIADAFYDAYLLEKYANILNISLQAVGGDYSKLKYLDSQTLKEAESISNDKLSEEAMRFWRSQENMYKQKSKNYLL